MGEVWRARDSKLGREVAIKTLPEEFAQDEERLARFEREAKLLASLNHPNIATIHGLEEDNGTRFLVLELVEGDTLADRLNRGAIPIEESLELALQVAEAVEAAHEKGVIHRDLKPANIKVTPDGQVKVLDFGLAKASLGDGAGADPANAATISIELTQPGTVLGTPAYMSPEQARGYSTDARTDIWSFGCVLYEMLTGRQTFAGPTTVDVVSALVTAAPEWELLPNQTPPTLSSLLKRCLEKDVQQRLPRIEEGRVELEQVVSASRAPVGTLEEGSQLFPNPGEKSIAVLPFTNMSSDLEQDYFSDGLTEEIIADLSQLGGLRVISRTSVMRLKDTTKDLKTIGRELNVRFLLEGSVRKAGNSLRVTAQLIDVATDAHLWAEKYSGTLDDVFAIQEQLSQTIVGELELTLSPEEERRIAERPIDDGKAYACYLQATQELYRVSDESLNRAVQVAQNGLVNRPGFSGDSIT